MGRATVLVIDDDESVRRYLSVLLPSLQYDVRCCESGEEGLTHLATQLPAAVLLDLLLPGLSGLEVLDRIKQSHPGVPVVVLSTVAEIKTVVDAVRRGATFYLTKPFQPHELELTLQNALEKQELREEVSFLRRRLVSKDADEFVSVNPHMLRIKEIGRQVADTDAPVLILGESGVGKEVIARYIHGQSRRRARPFVKVNCAALPQDLLESELFGYERGAFSGALREKPGMFELADTGTILLDEIGEMSPGLQAKLLHVLQDGEYTRLGGRQSVRVDARVLAATNSQLEDAVAAGRFRGDLYFRLNVIRLDVPPLRERREDIPLLCAHFVRPYALRYNRPVRQIPRELREAFDRHDWPGNVRELENAVRRFVILPDVDLALAGLRRAASTAAPPARPASAPAAETLPPPDPAESALDQGLSLRTVAARAAEEAERKLAVRVLAQTRWNRKEAASQLKISYKALLNKLKKWDVEEPPPPRSDRALPADAEQPARAAEATLPTG
jgi:two-component system, NtrC family, response regulator AtoC